MNSGVLTLSPPRARVPVMVSGQGRSGTTAMARVLRAMGYAGYWDDDSRNAEELAVQQAWEWGDRESLSRVHEDRLQAPWVCKVPNASWWATHWPVMSGAWGGDWILMVRDPLMMSAHDGEPRFDRWRHRASGYAETVECSLKLSQTGRGVSVVCYEALLTKPLEVFDELGFEQRLGMALHWDRYLSARREIVPSDPRYYGTGH